MPERTYSYKAVVSQPRESAPTAVLFVAPAEEVLSWAKVNRLQEGGGGGQQRRMNDAKVRAIAKFLERDDKNSIPTAITVALQLDDANWPAPGECFDLTIPERSSETGVVIDGQHRLYGIKAFKPEMLVNVVALINPSQEEIAFQFVVINNKAQKVPTDHLKYLNLTLNNEVLTERLRAARLPFQKHASLAGIVDDDPESPFFKLLDWPIEPAAGEPARDGFVKPAAIEQSFSVIAQQGVPELGDEDALLDFFLTIWTETKLAWDPAWKHEDSRLLSKAAIVALTTFFVDSLIPLADQGMLNLGDMDAVRVQAQRILGSLEVEFWMTPWTHASLDTSGGRKMIADSLLQIMRNKRLDLPWYSDVKLVAAQDVGSGDE